jgi:hypothetical protein
MNYILKKYVFLTKENIFAIINDAQLNESSINLKNNFTAANKYFRSV